MKKIIAGVIVIVLIIFGISYFSKNSDKPANKEPIKIGFIGPLTGDVTALGQASQTSVQIAEDEINVSGGINGRPVQVIYEDGKCSPVPAVTAAQKLISFDKVVAIVGGLCSSETSAFIKLAMATPVPVISYCSSAPSLSSSGKFFFRTYPSDSYQGKYAAEYAFNTLKAKNIAILYHISDWGTGIKEVFTKRFIELGGKIVITEGTTQETREYKTQLIKIQSTNPDYLYMPMYTEGALVAVQQAQNLSIKTKILAADAWDDPKFVSAVNKNADIIYVGSSGNSSDSFKAKYFAKTNEKEIPICAPQAYDAMTALATALKQVGTDPDKLQSAIRGEKFQGVVGIVSFDQNGDINRDEYVVKRIRNGQVIEIQ